MDMNRLRTNWIWLPNWIPENDSDARIVYFRKEMMLKQAGTDAESIKQLNRVLQGIKKDV